MKSKVIVITGATDSVGAAAARRLVSDGHHVVLVGRSADKTAALAQELATAYFLAVTPEHGADTLVIDDGATNDRSLRPFMPAHSRHTRGVRWWLSRNIDESATFR